MSERDDIGPLGPEEEDAALAAEYVLRLLDATEEAAARARMAADPAFAALVTRWREDLGAWDADVAPVPPPRALKRRVERRLFGPKPPVLAQAWQSAALWRSLAAAGAAAIVLGLVAFQPRPPLAPGIEAPRLVAALATLQGDAEFLVLIEPEAAALSIARVAGAPGPGRGFELWFIAEGAPPVSLGVLPDADHARVAVGREIAARFAAGALLAVSDEPAGGSPTGQPTGDVLAAGPARAL